MTQYNKYRSDSLAAATVDTLHDAALLTHVRYDLIIWTFYLEIGASFFWPIWLFHIFAPETLLIINVSNSLRTRWSGYNLSFNTNWLFTYLENTFFRNWINLIKIYPLISWPLNVFFDLLQPKTRNSSLIMRNLEIVSSHLFSSLWDQG